MNQLFTKMSRIRRFLSLSIGQRLMVIVSIVLALLGLVQSASAQVLVIGNRQAGVHHLTALQVSQIYKGRPTSLSNEYRPIDQPTDSFSYKEFVKKVLKSSPNKMLEYWASRRVHDHASAPQQVRSLARLLAMARNAKHVIIYLDSDDLQPGDLNDLQVLYRSGEKEYKVPVVKIAHQHKKVPARHKKRKSKVVKKGAVLTVEQAPGVWGTVLSVSHWDQFVSHPGVQVEIKNFLKNNDLRSRVNNASPYLGYVVQLCKRYHVPVEFVLLPLLESNYNASAENESDAGLWQLARGTAKIMKVPVTSTYDGRKDITAGTKASLVHLKDEFARFHNWTLAAAAYNCGSAAVEHAIEYNRAQGLPTNYWAIRSQLSPMTQMYVPRLVALTHVLKHASHYGIYLPNLTAADGISAVVINDGLTLQLAADLSGQSLSKLQAYNPGLLNGQVPAGQRYSLLLPTTSLDEFNEGWHSLSHERVRLVKRRAAKATEIKRRSVEEKVRQLVDKKVADLKIRKEAEAKETFWLNKRLRELLAEIYGV